MSVIMISVPVLFALIAIEYAAARWMGRTVYRLNDSISNLANAIAKRISNIAVDVLFLLVYAWIYHNFRLQTIPENSLAGWIALYILLDLVYYWHHRFSHRVNFAWAAHSTHHQSEEFNLTVALRMSGVQTVIHWCFNLSVAFLGFPPLMLLTVYTTSTVAMFWYHTRLIRSLGPLEWLLMTPSHHRVHHGRDAQYLDKNYGGIFVVWDILFGTFRRETAEPDYGVVSPIQAWNPVWAQFERYASLARQTLGRQGSSGKFLLWLRPPDWEKQRTEATGETPRLKYDPSISGSLRLYVIVRFLVIACYSIYFFYAYKHYDLFANTVISVYVFLGMTAVTVLLEDRRFSKPLEVISLLVAPILMVIVYRPPLPALLAAALYSAGSIAWLVSLSRSRDSAKTADNPTMGSGLTNEYAFDTSMPISGDFHRSWMRTEADATTPEPTAYTSGSARTGEGGRGRRWM